MEKKQIFTKATTEAKEYLPKNGKIEVLSGTGLSRELPQIDVSVGGSWLSRGWFHAKALLTYALRKLVKFLVLS